MLFIKTSKSENHSKTMRLINKWSHIIAHKSNLITYNLRIIRHNYIILCCRFSGITISCGARIYIDFRTLWEELPGFDWDRRCHSYHVHVRCKFCANIRGHMCKLGKKINSIYNLHNLQWVRENLICSQPPQIKTKRSGKICLLWPGLKKCQNFEWSIKPAIVSARVFQTWEKKL